MTGTTVHNYKLNIVYNINTFASKLDSCIRNIVSRNFRESPEMEHDLQVS